MDKQRILTACAAFTLIVIFSGLYTTHTDFQDPPRSSVDLSIYGHYIGSDERNPPYLTLGGLARAGEYKYHLMGATLLLGLGGLICFRKKH